MATHYRIYVYTPAHMPPDEPVAVSLCPHGRYSGDPLAGELGAVDCDYCNHFIRQLGLSDEQDD